MFEDKKDRQVIKLPFGMRDILPPETEERNKIREVISREFKLWGYGEVKTPVIEYTGNISVGAGKNWKNKLISFFDSDGNPVSLRTDMTIPIARLTGMRINKKQLPVRFCYFADSFRQSGIQKGLRRIYNQAGLEFIGSAGNIAADVEILIVLLITLNKLNISNYKIGLGHAELTEGLFDWFKLDAAEREIIRKKVILKDFVSLENFLGKKDKKKAEIFIKLLQPRNDFQKTADLISRIKEDKVSRSFNYISNIYNILGEFKYRDYLITDFSIIKDFSYYTGLLFEVYCQDINDIIGSGGRYDGLIKKFGMDVPATGFALDIDLTHKAAGRSGQKEDFKILLTGTYPLDDKSYAELIKLADRLHKKGILAEVCYEDKPDIESFAKEKKYNLLVEVEPDFKKLKVTDISRNIRTVLKISDFIKEIDNGK